MSTKELDKDIPAQGASELGEFRPQILLIIYLVRQHYIYANSRNLLYHRHHHPALTRGHRRVLLKITAIHNTESPSAIIFCSTALQSPKWRKNMEKYC